ncbi:hypothetical protein NliqN6_0544 [Naganishia liquefaciens]|uniref:RRM domain-containing protein n=1 Tax=Naganishia liquefaciens TaxID=104408 RepID=A0A8H3TN69_9TREE|nr:hypothetical protein NliqN6_0544 [Naganishia liquefaciens]
MMRSRPHPPGQGQQPPQNSRANPSLLHTTKTVFVANIPFDVTEEQLTSIFSEVGPVQEFVLKFDQNTGKAKGFGFCHYFDHETALSAVRNLQEVVVNGRNLRVELSTDEPYKPKNTGPSGAPRAGQAPGMPPMGMGGGPGMPPRGFAQPPSQQQGQGFAPPGGFTPPQQGMGMGPGAGMNPGMGMGMGMGMGRPPPPPMGMAGGPGQGVNMGMLPPGQDLAGGQKATDAISKTLASIPPGKLEEVLTGMKTLVQTSPEQARTVLNSHPQLAYALFQAMLLMNVVDPAVLSRIQPIPNPGMPNQAQAPRPPAPPAFRPPPAGYPSSVPGPVAQQPSQQQQPTFTPHVPPPQAMPPFAPSQQSLPPRPPAPGGYVGTPPQGGMPSQPMSQPMPSFTPAPPAPAAASVPPLNAGMPPAQGGNQQAIAAALSMVSEDQRQMLVQVFQLTPEQISALPADQQAGVHQLRSQFGIV